MLNFFVYLIVVGLIILIILIATYFINSPSNDYEKRSAY